MSEMLKYKRLAKPLSARRLSLTLCNVRLGNSVSPSGQGVGFAPARLVLMLRLDLDDLSHPTDLEGENGSTDKGRGQISREYRERILGADEQDAREDGGTVYDVQDRPDRRAPRTEYERV